jgi:hypothetical protein
MTVISKYQWKVVSPKCVRNEYGEFQKYGDIFIFIGSYLSRAWVMYWHDETLQVNDFNLLMRVVEKKITRYKWQCRFAGLKMWMSRLAILSLLATGCYFLLLLAKGLSFHINI